MKATLTQTDLLAALAAVSQAIPKRPTHPILATVKIEVKPAWVTFTGFDLETAVQIRVNPKTAVCGTVCAPHRFLLDLVRTLDEDVLLWAENGKLQIRSGAISYTVQLADSDDYPELPQPKADSTKLDRSALSEAYKGVHAAAAVNEGHPLLEKVALQFGTTISAAATNGHRLATWNIADWNANNETILIPPKFLRQIAFSNTESYKVTQSKAHISFESDNVRYTSRLCEGKYPDIKSLLNNDYKTQVLVSSQMLKEAIIRAKQISNPILLEVGYNQITVCVDDEFAAGKEVIYAQDKSSKIVKLSINPIYLLDAISAINSLTIEIAYKNPTQPIIISSPDKLNSIHLVMPLQTR